MSKYEHGYYVLTKNNSSNQPYHWVLKAPNHEVILSSEMYSSKHAALNGIDSVRVHSSEDSNYDRLTAKNGNPYFNLKSKNHQIIGSSETYSSEQKREVGIKAVKKYGGTLTLVDETNEESVTTTKPEKSQQAGRYA
ncbi:YegP family protein [Aliarcobacter butzleri]|uniref:YegP family protein n=1 Tax=Aliarcobacter butzleri TaxID=28197 RepID=UPI0021B22E17|nr:YegP family protein [Aliarcobacter butzleri]MCT7586823.1 YegP family protein [Aliarcobacter butzleri]MDS1316024.1 YegP family protein [Aliarcobacter butzleri]